MNKTSEITIIRGDSLIVIEILQEDIVVFCEILDRSHIQYEVTELKS